MRHRERGPAHASFADSLRGVLRTELLKSTCSAEAMAERFFMHRRTLSRHLKAEGTAFRRIAGEVQFEIACRLLLDPCMSFSRIATALGFSEGSAFTRAFRRWSGETPTTWRARHRMALQMRECSGIEVRSAPLRRPHRAEADHQPARPLSQGVNLLSRTVKRGRKP